MAAATAAAYMDQNPPFTALRRLFSNTYEEIAEVNNHIELVLHDERQALPSGSLTLMGNDPLAETVLGCDQTVVPFVYDKGAYRWSGRVDVAHDKFNGGKPIVQCELVGDLTWLDRICCWPDPFLPIFIQEPTEWWGMGPLLTVLTTLLQEQVWRLQLGFWGFVNNLSGLNVNWKNFIAPLLTSNVKLTDLQQLLTTPVYVVGVDPLTDTSPWIEINGKMDTIWKLIQQQLADNGCDVTATAWFPGEPQPPGATIPLTVPTVVVQFKNFSGITGPTGTFVAGAVINVVQLEGSILGNALSPLLNPTNKDPFLTPDLGEYIAPTLGVDFQVPWILFDLDTPRSGVIDFDVAHHGPIAYQVIVGGQSPKWVNDLINATLEWGIDSLLIGIGLTGIPNSIFDGIFDNVILAYSLVDNLQTRLSQGPFCWPEKFFPSQAGALTVDSFFAEVAGLWDVRPWPSAQVTFIDGYPYELGRDLVRSQLVTLVRRGVVYVDYVEKITITDNRTQRNKIELQIGDGKSEEGGMIKAQRRMAGMERWIYHILSGGNPSS